MIPVATDRKTSDPLRICLLTYRGNPACGGQGVYIKYLSRALRELGHQVDVISGPPYPDVAQHVTLHRFPSLDLYNSDHLFKVKKLKDLKSPVNQLEFLIMCLGGFPEPLTFGMRVYRYFRRELPQYDVVHDNQCLAYGVYRISRIGYPTVATIHHPITIDRDTEMADAKTWREKLKVRRWYAFIGMQMRVSRRLARIITVSECSKQDIGRTFKIPAHRFRVVPNGINTDFFYPLPHVKRARNHIVVTNSADTPLKGLSYLLDAFASVRKKRDIRLTVIGSPKENGRVRHLVKELGIHDCVTFTGRIENEEFAGYYAEATMAVIPSVYEGFGMPAGEAMACGVPVISTTGGALPEVVGDAGILVPPRDKDALEYAIVTLLDNPEMCDRLGRAGLDRVKKMYTWHHAAKKIEDAYRETIDAHR